LKLITGLGNPGRNYELTRHNIGFIVLDYVAYKLNLKFTPGKGQWYETYGNIEDTEFYLIKPTTYMNNSGIAVEEFLTNNEISPNNLLVVYDDFQLPLGTIRLRTKGSDGGHNGISSVIYHLNTMDFPRMRIGIGKDETIIKDEYIDFVLTQFDKDEKEKIKTLLPNYYNCILSYINEDIMETMNKFNRNFLIEE
jgi:PTH1 family peptidyl-tRNA hydrolase